MRVPFEATVISVCHETDQFSIDLRNGIARTFTAAELSALLKCDWVISDLRVSTLVKLYWRGCVTCISTDRKKDRYGVQLEDGSQVWLSLEEAQRLVVPEAAAAAALTIDPEEECAICYSEFGVTVPHACLNKPCLMLG